MGALLPQSPVQKNGEMDAVVSMIMNNFLCGKAQKLVPGLHSSSSTGCVPDMKVALLSCNRSTDS